MSSNVTQIGRGRAVHLIDVENLCGSSLPSIEQVAKLRRDYFSTVPVGNRDQFILASAHASALAMGAGWPGMRYLWKSGKDGADKCLGQTVVDENLHERFDHVFFGSGDGFFADFAAYVEGKGTRTTAVSLLGSMSIHMRLASSNSLYLRGDRQMIRRALPAPITILRAA